MITLVVTSSDSPSRLISSTPPVLWNMTNLSLPILFVQTTIVTMAANITAIYSLHWLAVSIEMHFVFEEFGLRMREVFLASLTELLRQILPTCSKLRAQEIEDCVEQYLWFKLINFWSSFGYTNLIIEDKLLAHIDARHLWRHNFQGIHNFFYGILPTYLSSYLKTLEQYP